MNILEFDLNELLSKQIQEKIEDLQNKVNRLKAEKEELRVEKLAATKQLEAVAEMGKVATLLKRTFNDLETGKAKLKFIEGLMSSVFGVRKKYDFCSGPSWKNLAVNYYDHKEKILSILAIVGDDRFVDISKLKAFKMPKDLSEQELLNFLDNMHTCPNGEYWRVSSFYIGALENKKHGALENAPYSLIFENELMVSHNVFNSILDKMRKSTSSMKGAKLYKLYKYQKLTKSQIQQIGETLCEVDIKAIAEKIGNTYARDFLADNIRLLSKKTLEIMFKYVGPRDGQGYFNWTKFPMKYQQRFLMSKDISEVLKFLSLGSCNWTTEDKDEFLKQYYNQK